MIHHLLPALYAMFITKTGGRSLYSMSFSTASSRHEQWASICYARKHNQRSKAQKRGRHV
jgi:predicted GNAT superfamily acetyltransferase